MKLVHIINLRLTLLTALMLVLWAVVFYFTMMYEINDEIDDQLEDYAEMIILRKLRGETLPNHSSGSNNQFFLKKVSTQYAKEHSCVRYRDRDVYIEAKHEYEPARVLTYIFRDEQNQYWKIEVSIPNVDKTDFRTTLFGSIIILFCGLLLGILLVNFFTLNRSLRPLNKLLQWLSNYNLGKANPTLQYNTNIVEFKQLNEAAIQNSKRSEKLYEQQKLFIGNASHELQTPIAVCQNRLEMMLDNTLISPEQMEQIVKVLRTLRQMSHLNSSLLLLAKLENGQRGKTNNVDCGQMIRRLNEDISTVYAFKEIKCRIQQSVTMFLTINMRLANTLFSNLLKNAYIHSPHKGEIRVSISSDSVSISNTATEGPLDKEHIFDRFYHDSSKVSSTGLGLALAKSICNSYSLKLDYRYEDSFHIFILKKII